MRPGPGRALSSWRKIAGILDIRAKPAPDRSVTAPGAESLTGRLDRKRRTDFKTRYFGTDTMIIRIKDFNSVASTNSARRARFGA